MISGGGNRLPGLMKLGKGVVQMLKCHAAGWSNPVLVGSTFEIPRTISDAVGFGNRGFEVVQGLYKGVDQFPVWLRHTSALLIRISLM